MDRLAGVLGVSWGIRDMRIGYYPGCALHGSSNDYEKSLRACLDRLDVELSELDDWTCCGATAAHSINEKLATALPARNLAIAERDGIDRMLAPCPMCSMELIKAARTIGFFLVTTRIFRLGNASGNFICNASNSSRDCCRGRGIF